MNKIPHGLEELPNVGPVIAGRLRRLGVKSPQDLYGRDPYQMYDDACRLENGRVDLCVLDVFLAAVDFVHGGRAKPWWKFTAQRKRRLKARGKDEQ